MVNRTQIGKILRLQKSILDAIPYAMIATTTDGMISYYNGSAERMFGYSSEEMVGRHCVTVLHDPHELAARMRNAQLQTDCPVNGPFGVLVAHAWQGQAGRQAGRQAS